jgi:hypothetical protein
MCKNAEIANRTFTVFLIRISDIECPGRIQVQENVISNLKTDLSLAAE